MAAQDVPLIRADEAIVNPDGTPSRRFFLAISGMRLRLGGDDDKVDAAYQTAGAAVPQTTQVVAGGGLALGGALDANVGVSLYKAMTSVAALPSLGNAEGDFAYAVNGLKVGETTGAGTGVPVFWSNGNWVAVDSGASVAS